MMTFDCELKDTGELCVIQRARVFFIYWRIVVSLPSLSLATVPVSSYAPEDSETACLLMKDHTDALNYTHKRAGQLQSLRKGRIGVRRTSVMTSPILPSRMRRLSSIVSSGAWLSLRVSATSYNHQPPHAHQPQHQQKRQVRQNASGTHARL